MPTQPTGKTLPALVFDPKTRVGGEFYLYYNLGQAYRYGSVGVDGEGDPTFRAEAPCAGNLALPASGFQVIRAAVPIKADVESTWEVDSLTAKLPPFAPPGAAAELTLLGGTPITPTLGNLDITGAVPGDSVDIMVLPNPEDEVLICYDEAFNMDVGDEQKAIGRKFSPVDHYVRQRPNNQLTISDLYVTAQEGLAALRNRPVTLIGKFFPDGGAAVGEIYYWTNVMLNVPFGKGDDVNESVKISATGMFDRFLSFTLPRS
jgi:hypothetical protein